VFEIVLLLKKLLGKKNRTQVDGM